MLNDRSRLAGWSNASSTLQLTIWHWFYNGLTHRRLLFRFRYFDSEFSHLSWGDSDPAAVAAAAAGERTGMTGDARLTTDQVSYLPWWGKRRPQLPQPPADTSTTVPAVPTPGPDRTRGTAPGRASVRARQEPLRRDPPVDIRASACLRRRGRPRAVERVPVR